MLYEVITEYSHNFCTLIGTLFVIQNILYFYFDDKKNIVCFELFFAISFGLTNFVYPIFYYQTQPHVSVFALPFNEHIISKATAIAYLGYTSFMLGITKLINMNRLKPEQKTFTFNTTSFQILFIITIITFIFYMSFGGLSALRSVYSGHGDITKVGIYSYFYNLFVISCLLLGIFIFKLKNKTQQFIYLLFIVIFSLLIITTGSRSFLLGLGLIIIVGYNNFIKKISFYKVAIILLTGTFLLFLIVMIRSNDFTEGKWLTFNFSQIKVKSFFDLYLDLIINNRNLYVLTDYADKNDLIFFNGMLVDIFSPIPGMTGILSGWLNVPVETITGGALPTYLAFGANSSFGLGTNMIGEAYVTFGIAGVILFSYFIGRIVKITYYASRYNIYAHVIYYLFISHAIMYPRAPILYNPRFLVWSLILIYMVYHITKYTEKFNSTKKKLNS